MRCRFAALLCLLYLVGWTGLACAQIPSGNERIKLTYQAPLDCPTQSEFEAQVSQRVSFHWLATEADGFARPLRIEVVRAQAFWQAGLTYRDHDGHGLTRSVTAASCEASVAALALATALLIEALVDEVADRSAQSNAVPLPDARRVVAAPGPAPTASPSAEPRKPQEAGPIAMTLSASSAGTDSQPSQRRPDLGVGVAALSGLSVSPAYGATVLVGIPIASMLPRLGMAIYQSSLSPTVLPGVRMRVRLLAALLEECPVSVGRFGPISIPICIGVGSGLLTTSSQMDPAAVATGKTSSDFWLMAALAPRLRVQERWLFVQLGPDLVVPVTRREFVVARDAGRLEPAYRTPAVAIGVQSMLGVQF